MPPDLQLDDDSDYSSADDSDFAPETAPITVSDAESDAESDDGNQGGQINNKPKTTKGKRKRASAAVTEEAEDVGFENSGDEEIVERGLKRQKRKGKKSSEDEDDGGEGGFVKTRRMAALAAEEKKPLANTTSATVDVDALWARMMSGTTKATIEPKIQESNPTEAQNGHGKPSQVTEDGNSSNGDRMQSDSPVPEDLMGEDMIMIQRTYNFAGKVHVEEKLVARDSAEARLWQDSQSSGKNLSQPIDPNRSKPLRPPKQARRSIFEPITDPLPQRADLRFGVGAVGRGGNAAGANGHGAAKKLNTVEKSKMDWAGFVDKEGIKDDLEVAGKSKGAYLDQKEFLARVEEKRDEEARRARLKI